MQTFVKSVGLNLLGVRNDYVINWVGFGEVYFRPQSAFNILNPALPLKSQPGPEWRWRASIGIADVQTHHARPVCAH